MLRSVVSTLAANMMLVRWVIPLGNLQPGGPTKGSSSASVFLKHGGGPLHWGRISGAEANGQDAGYEQRVDMEMTNDAKGVAGVRVRRNPASC